SMARNFLSEEALSDRFFTLMAFLHLIGLPLFLVFGIWLHVFRISRPKINPPRRLMIGTLLVMLLLSLIYPALSQGQADLAVAPQNISLDWYYLLVYPLVKLWSPGLTWLLLSGFSLLLFLAPWLPPAGKPPVARVDLDNCNGCRRCVDDCPYGAVMMQPRSDELNYEEQAVVDPDLCVSCGICVGACPTATPFRKASALSPGIDLPDLSAALLRIQLEEACAGLRGHTRTVVLGCKGSPSLQELADHETAVVNIRCMAHLPPPFIDFILSRNLADGIFLAGCKGGDCEYRIGMEWCSQRISRERDPQLRKRIDTRRVVQGWEPAMAGLAQPARALSALRKQLLCLEGEPAGPGAEGESARSWWKKLPVRMIAYGLFAITASAFSAWPAFSLIKPGQAIVSLSFSHAGQRVEECIRLSQEELNKLPPNMRKPSNCPRERRPVQVEFRVDGETVYQQVRPPSGVWNDGESTVYARIPVYAGTHHLFIGLNDSGTDNKFDYELAAEVELKPEQHVVVEFDSDARQFIFR
ncbi:MAG TPA: 4Fe-4S binding protein, partial [Xanthomonadales bacterium]|nr:4Fe-4S binding protein [Xanthomonadales bacterium]